MPRAGIQQRGLATNTKRLINACLLLMLSQGLDKQEAQELETQARSASGE